ncbi:hypothetical protein Rhe02_07530 [Rhizocola hellebori]|uniref:Uncharacterized protein n=1 Tax=Rhizocola hellebori TaxID=1392758 RepID=A0A8J3Q2Y8_9ACTN|nr:hypothetical protein [Rhizocola hellebori]GIH02686.1 hypothetical protein Rhe02_07530 [Rhizocola hellebori]
MAEIFNLVLGRADNLLVRQRGVEAFGRVPRNLFALGGGWQRLDIWQPKGSMPEFPGPQAVQFLAESTGAPVLTAQISSAGGCADVWAATPSWGMWRAHLPRQSSPCGWEHVLPPSKGNIEHLMANVVEWVEAAGLTADLAEVKRWLSGESGRDAAWDSVPYLIDALGLPHDDANLVEPLLNIREPPFSRVFDAFDDAWWGEKRWSTESVFSEFVLPLYGERRRLAQDVFDSMYPEGPYTVVELTDRLNDLHRRGGLRD